MEILAQAFDHFTGYWPSLALMLLVTLAVLALMRELRSSPERSSLLRALAAGGLLTAGALVSQPLIGWRSSGLLPMLTEPLLLALGMLAVLACNSIAVLAVTRSPSARSRALVLAGALIVLGFWGIHGLANHLFGFGTLNAFGLVAMLALVLGIALVTAGLSVALKDSERHVPYRLLVGASLLTAAACLIDCSLEPEIADPLVAISSEIIMLMLLAAPLGLAWMVSALRELSALRRHLRETQQRARAQGLQAESAERRAEGLARELERSGDRFALVAAGTADGLWEFDLLTRGLHMSARMAGMLELGERECVLPVSALWPLLGSSGRAHLRQDLRRHWRSRGRRPLRCELRLELASGQQRWMQVRGATRFSESDKPMRLAGSLTDITLARRREQELRTAANVFELNGEPILLSNGRGQIEAVNAALERVFGLDRSALIGQSVRLLLERAESPAKLLRGALCALRSGEWRGEIEIQGAGDTLRVLALTVARLRDPGSGEPRFIWSGTDLTARRAAEAHAAALAFLDPLTGLPNRSSLEAFASPRVDGGDQPLAVLLFDLDRFKLVNDTLGHREGDLLLMEVSARIRRLMGDEQQLFRLGGDEFLLLVRGDAAFQARAHARTILDAIAQPMRVGSRELSITSSAGLALRPRDGREIDVLLRRADSALYRAKANGRNVLVAFEPDMERSVAVGLDLLGDLSEALTRDEFELRYQPVVDLQTRRIVGLEALLYWQHPRFGLLSPGRFVEQAEDAGVADALTRGVVARLRQELPRIAAAFGERPRIAINLSGGQLQRPDALIAQLGGLVELADIDVEVIERQVLFHSEETDESFRRLEKLGIGVSIDDFGTGYASFELLRRLPVSTLKIDRRFVINVEHEPRVCAVLRAFHDLGRALGLRVISEGIETPEQVKALRQLGYRLMQGYYFGRPMNVGVLVATHASLRQRLQVHAQIDREGHVALSREPE